MPVGDIIVMNTLRYANELRAMDEVEVPSGALKRVGVKEREVDMARRLVEEMNEAWKPETFHDTYHEDLMTLIEKRIKTGQTETVISPEQEEETQPAKGEIIDLMALLKRSVETKGKGRRPTAEGRGHGERQPRRKRIA
jgi:DNA end-binding protein Ku